LTTQFCSLGISQRCSLVQFKLRALSRTLSRTHTHQRTSKWVDAWNERKETDPSLSAIPDDDKEEKTKKKGSIFARLGGKKKGT